MFFCNNGTNYVIQKSLCHEEEPINQVMKKVYNKQIKCRGGVIGYMKRRQNLIILAVNMSINYTRRIQSISWIPGFFYWKRLWKLERSIRRNSFLGENLKNFVTVEDILTYKKYCEL